MKFTRTALDDLWLVELEPHGDSRGYFARSYCDEEFSEQGLNTVWPQSNLTLTRKRGALRGMHFQAEPSPETKLVRCMRGKVFDCVVDVRPTSDTFGQWEAFELSRENQRALYIPAGYAHGFQCLEEECELWYQMSSPYDPALARGLRWDDPTLAIRWPLPVSEISERDSELPFLDQLQ